MHHEIAWCLVERILIDAPNVETDENGSSSDTEVNVTTENASKVLEMINNINR